MKKEQLEEGNKLQKTIDELTTHLNNLENDKKITSVQISYFNDRYRDEVSLKTKYLNVDDIMLLYKSRLKKQIDILQEQLDNL